MEDHRNESLPPDEGNVRILRLLSDLTAGVISGEWQNHFYVEGIPAWRELFLNREENPQLTEYIRETWNNQTPNVALLEDLGYLVEIPGSSIGGDTSAYKLTQKALEGR